MRRALRRIAGTLRRIWCALPLVLILTRREVECMAVVYATLIVRGKKTFAQVPERIKEAVKQVLVDLDCAELAE